MWNVNGFVGVRRIDVLTLGPRVYPYIFLSLKNDIAVPTTVSIISKRDPRFAPARLSPTRYLCTCQALLDLTDVHQLC